MSLSPSLPGSPGGPLQAITAERVNQRDSILSQIRGEAARESSVHDKISQFNNLSVSLQSKNLERKTADAALKRAMMGREEAESDVRRYRDECKALHKAVEEGKERERRVGERLETLMENYGRAKETHAHTQALWEKEIRRARKETFKTQSSIVKLQEELKSARASAKTTYENLKREKERCKVREQEAFEARYQIVGVQEQLEQALERIKLVEQERDAFKTAAKNEEVARIAAEGRIPLPRTDTAEDEFSSPTKNRREPRVSLSTADIMSSVASEQEIEELALEVQWERQRADRALEMVEFLQAECHLRCCPCSKSQGSPEPRRQKRRSSIGLEGPAEKAVKLNSRQRVVTPRTQEPEPLPQSQVEVEPQAEPQAEHQSETAALEQDIAQDLAVPKPRKGPRLSTIFCPKEGIFRTVSEQEAEAVEAQHRLEVESAPQEDDIPEDEEHEEDERESHDDSEKEAHEPERSPRRYARTPSVEPPSFAILAKERTSLLSLLNAPHSGSQGAGEANLAPLPSIPTMPDTEPRREVETEAEAEAETEAEVEAEVEAVDAPASPDNRPHTAAAFYTVTTTTKVPVCEDEPLNSSFSQRLRTPSHNTSGISSSDLANPALTPTMTREQALAKIRERRGRARSAAQGAATPRRRMVEGVDRRDMSAPTARVTGNAKTPRR